MAVKKTDTKKANRINKVDQTAATVTVPKETGFSLPRPQFKLSKGLYLLLLILGIVVLLVILSSRYLIVAWVDKKPITRFEYYQQLGKKYGKDFREQMIVEKLILDEAQKRGVTVSASEIQDEIKKFEAQQGGAAQLDQILTMQGLSKDEFNKLVRLQLLRQKMFSNGITVTDDEVNKYTDQNKDQIPEVTEKTKNDIKEQLRQQKINSNFKNWLQQELQGPRVQRIY